MEGGAAPGPGFGSHGVGPEAGGNAAALGGNPGHVEAHAEGEEDGDHVEEAGGQRAGVEGVLTHGLQREEVRGQQEEQPEEWGRPGAAQEGPQAGHSPRERLLQPVQVRAVAEERACGGREGGGSWSDAWSLEAGGLRLGSWGGTGRKQRLAKGPETAN